MRIAVLGETAINHVTRSVGVEWTVVSRNHEGHVGSVPSDVDELSCPVIQRDPNCNASLRELHFVKVGIRGICDSRGNVEMSAVPSG
jgi:hypothetical protein